MHARSARKSRDEPARAAAINYLAGPDEKVEWSASHAARGACDLCRLLLSHTLPILSLCTSFVIYLRPPNSPRLTSTELASRLQKHHEKSGQFSEEIKQIFTLLYKNRKFRFYRAYYLKKQVCQSQNNSRRQANKFEHRCVTRDVRSPQAS